MKILIAHNTYQRPGGEDVVVQHETRMLEEAGHTVIHLERSNREIEDLGAIRKGLLPLSSIWSQGSYRRMQALLEVHGPDVVHIHNTHLMLSPSIVHASVKTGIPTVSTLHNWRRLCPAGTQFRDGQDRGNTGCGGIQCILRGCYRSSVVATATVSLNNSIHSTFHTWRNVHNIVMSEFARRRFAQAGVERIHVKPHFLSPDPGMSPNHGDYALFLGSMIEEKGVFTLLRAWSLLKSPVPLVVAGDGPLLPMLKAWSLSNGNWSGIRQPLGQLNRHEAVSLVRNARFVVVPSQWAEPFGMVAIEALAAGVPVIASDAGALPEIVMDGMNGLIFPRLASDELTASVERLWHDKGLRNRLSEGARESYLQRYTAEKNYPALMRVYAAAGTRTVLHEQAVAV